MKDYRFIGITGKGGVGRTTIAAALAKSYALKGRRTLLATAFSAEALSDLVGIDVDHRIQSAGDNLDVFFVDHRESRKEYGSMILHSRALYGAVFESSWVSRFLDAVPGLAEWAVLGKATYHALEEEGTEAYDTVVFDAPSTGHALEMLRLPKLIQQVLVVGRLHDEAQKRVDLFSNPSKCGFVIVASPEELAAREAMEISDSLESELGVNPAMLVVNHFTPNPFTEEETGVVESWPDDCRCAEHMALGKYRVRRCLRESSITLEMKNRIKAITVFVPHFSGNKAGPQELDNIVKIFKEH